MLKNMDCIYCDTKFSVEIYANYSVLCPCCKRNIFLECEYGHGPVTPCRIYLGSETAGIVESEGSHYYLTIHSKAIPLRETYLNALKEATQIMEEYSGVSRHREAINIQTKKGSICFYGDWFGRPFDDYKIIHNVYDGEILEIKFKQYERLLVYHPEKICSTEQELTIEKAKKVKWIYPSYQSLSTETFPITYTVGDGKIIKESKHGVEYLPMKEPFFAVYLGDRFKFE